MLSVVIGRKWESKLEAANLVCRQEMPSNQILGARG